MQLSPRTKFNAGLVAILGTATLAAIGVSAQGQTGGGASTPTSPGTAASPSPLNSQREVYFANLNPLSGSSASAVARIVVDQGRLGVYLQGSGFDPDVPVEAKIYQGTNCPTTSADTNGDGVVDETEAIAVAGQPVIPLNLNGDLSSQSAASSTTNPLHPLTAADGSLYYINAGSSSSIAPLPSPFVGGNAPGISGATPLPSLSPSPSPSPSVLISPSPSPLVSPSPSPSASASPVASPSASPSPLVSPTASPTASATPGPSFTPLTQLPPDTLGLTGRVIMIQGVSPNTQLPASAQPADSGRTAQQTLPVACGVIAPVAQ